MGRLLAERGAVLVCGGLGGAMEAACRGAKQAGGTTVGLLPGLGSRSDANPFVDVAIPTGLGEARNALVVRAADAVVAVGRRLRHAVRDRAGAQGGQAGGRARHLGDRRRGRRRTGPRRPSPRRCPRLAAHAASQSDTPYLDALRAFAERSPARLHVPGHKGGAGADPRLMDAIGERALALDIPALMWGIDVGVEPTPFAEAQRLAAEAWGARRTWFLVNGASQGNHVALLTLAHAGDRVVLQRNAHSSTIDALVLSGLRPTFAAPELDPELHIAHCLRPETLDAALAETPGAVGAAVVSPTYFGAVADVAALAEVAHGHGVPLIVDEAWGAHLAFSDELPAAALSLGADLVISSTHKIVGSLTQSAMVHLGTRRPDRRGRGRPLRDAGRVDQPERAARRRRSTAPGARRPWTGGRCSHESLRGLALTREAVREVPGLDVLDERLVGAAGVFAYDPLRLTIDVRGTLLERVRAGATAARAGRRARGAGRRERDGGGVRDGRGHGGRPASGWWRRCTGRSRR